MDIRWTYSHNGDRYLPLLIHDNKSLKQVVIKLKRIGNDTYKTTEQYDDIYNFKFFQGLSIDISPYHPNELTAYICSKLIIKPSKFSAHFYDKFKIFTQSLK